MKPENETTPPADEGRLEASVVPLLARLRALADLRRLEGDNDEAELVDEAVQELHNLAWALSLPGFDRMATDKQEAEHQAGMRRVNDMLARMEKAKAEHDAAKQRAEFYRWLRGGPDVPQHSLRWPRWEVRRWDGRWWQTLFAEQLDAHLSADMDGERHNGPVEPAPKGSARTGC